MIPKRMLGSEEEGKTVKKQFGKLPKAEQKRIETRYHELNPRDLDERMSRAQRQSPGGIRLPSKLVENLKTLAESEGEAEYQTMVKRWIEERLQQKTSGAR